MRYQYMIPAGEARKSEVAPTDHENDKYLIFPPVKPAAPRRSAQPKKLGARILSGAQERALFARHKAGDTKARDELIVANWGACAKIAHKYSGQLAFDAAHSAAMCGLITALDTGNFDPDKGRLFTFAWLWMKGEICEAIREAQVVRRPRGLKSNSAEVAVAFHGVIPSKDVAIDASPPGLLDSILYHDYNLYEPSAEDRFLEYLDAVEASDHRAALLRALEMLTDRERRIFVARRLSENPPTYRELGIEFGVSGEWVRQIEEAVTVKVFKAAPLALARLAPVRFPPPREDVSLAQARFPGLQRDIAIALFRPGSNRSYRERCRDIFHELIKLGDAPLRAVQRIRWVIIKWCRNRRIAERPAAPDCPRRTLSNRELLDFGFAPATIAQLALPTARPQRAGIESAAHSFLVSWAGRLAARGPRMEGGAV